VLVVFLEETSVARGTQTQNKQKNSPSEKSENAVYQEPMTMKSLLAVQAFLSMAALTTGQNITGGQNITSAENCTTITDIACSTEGFGKFIHTYDDNKAGRKWPVLCVANLHFTLRNPCRSSQKSSAKLLIAAVWRKTSILNFGLSSLLRMVSSGFSWY
jgi:hypothetical protein